MPWEISRLGAIAPSGTTLWCAPMRKQSIWGTVLQDGCVLHVDRGYPIILGDNVTVGHGAILHGCTVGENTVVGMGSILLNGCEVGRNSMVAAGALVPPGKTYPEGSLLIGSPAKVARALTEEEILANRNNAEVYVRLAKEAAGQE